MRHDARTHQGRRGRGRRLTSVFASDTLGPLGREFEDTDELRGARFTRVDLSGARFRDVDLRGAKIVDAFLAGADLSGIIDGLRVNGVEVAPLVEAELDRRDPDRVRIRNAKDPDALRDAWSLVETRWAATMERAGRLPEATLHERVDEEWSFVETLRHLIFVTDAWVRRPILGAADYHPLGLPQSGFGDASWIGIEAGVAPSFAEVADARTDRMRIVREIVDQLTASEFARVCGQNPAPGYPPQTIVPVGLCLGVTCDEEWQHHGYAVRDLDLLERASD